LIISKDKQVDLFFNSVKESNEKTMNLLAVLATHMRVAEESRGASESRTDLARCCDLIISEAARREKYRIFSPDLMAQVIKNVLELKQLELFHLAIKTFQGQLPLLAFESIGCALGAIGFDHLRLDIDKALERMESVTLQRTALSTLDSSFQALDPYERSKFSDNAESLKGFIDLKIESIVASGWQLSKTDGESLAGVVKRYGEDMLVHR